MHIQMFFMEYVVKKYFKNDLHCYQEDQEGHDHQGTQQRPVE